MKVLVLNCGSSSIKFQLFDMPRKITLAKGMAEKVGMKGSFVKLEKENGDKVRFEGEILDHQTGIEYILGIITSRKHGCIKSLDEIDAVGHRVVNGGEKFNKSALITDEVQAEVEKYIDLAPLHNPANLKGVYAIKLLMPGKPQVAYLILHFTRRCQNMPLCMLSPTRFIRNMVSASTASMAQVIITSAKGPVRYLM